MTDAEIEPAVRTFLEGLFHDEPGVSFVLVVTRPAPGGGSNVFMCADMEPDDIPALLLTTANQAMLYAASGDEPNA